MLGPMNDGNVTKAITQRVYNKERDKFSLHRTFVELL